MASRVLYPPSIDSSMPSFQVTTSGGTCSLKFSLSKFNGTDDIKGIHIAVTKQRTGMNMVKTTTEDTSGSILRYRKTGIIIVEKSDYSNPATQDPNSTNVFSIDLKSDDLFPTDGGYNGFIPGWLYKVQIRLSSASYTEQLTETPLLTQAAFLTSFASDFSEWSTVCTIKPIGDINLYVNPFDITISGDSASSITYDSSTLDFCGKFTSEDDSEILYSYQAILTKNNILIEDSGVIINENYQNMNEFRYLFKTELVNNANDYVVTFIYVTNNGFTKTVTFSFGTNYNITTLENMYIATVENYKQGRNVLYGISSVSLEEDEGRLGLKIVDDSATPVAFTGTLVIRRSSSRENFTIWEDIKILNLTNVMLNNMDTIYDYTIESGIWYLYGLQKIVDGNRSALAFPMNGASPIKNPSLRNFEFSYLLGENNQQLKLKFNNTMNSYKIQQMESKNEALGGQFPIISRNGVLGYRFFPVAGLISFEMDENNLFTNKQIIYKYQDVLTLYQNYKNNQGIAQYNYIYEKDFRKEVISFLINGKPKLFKSPTEGNIIVRLMDVNFTPNQSLDRLIYSFSANANEIAEDNLDNYIKYKFLDLYNIAGAGDIIDPGHIHTNQDTNDSPDFD